LLPVSLTRVNSMSDGTSAARQVRISDADRERAAQRLQQALVEGRITLNEMDERMAEVYAARFAGDLEGPFADLPEGALVPSSGCPRQVPARAPTWWCSAPLLGA